MTATIQRHTTVASTADAPTSGRFDPIVTGLAPAAWGLTYIVTTELLPPGRPLLAAALRARPAGLLLAALIAPFWISYMMRMLAWVNLLQNDGLVNQLITLGGLWDTEVDWLGGKSITVVLGLVYGYVPYMILPLYAGLDRIPAAMLEAGRDLGANRFQTWRRVTWPMSRQAVLTAVILTCLPMLGDYFTSDLLSGNPSTSMVGNLINSAVLTPGQTGQAAAFVLLVLLVSLLPMALYVRVTRAGEETRT